MGRQGLVALEQARQQQQMERLHAGSCGRGSSPVAEPARGAGRSLPVRAHAVVEDPVVAPEKLHVLPLSYEGVV